MRTYIWKCKNCGTRNEITDADNTARIGCSCGYAEENPKLVPLPYVIQIGDVIHLLLVIVGIHYLVKRYWKNCNCEKRRQIMNHWGIRTYLKVAERFRWNGRMRLLR